MIRIYVEAISKKFKIAIILAIALLIHTVALQSASVRCAAESENGITLIQIGFEKGEEGDWLGNGVCDATEAHSGNYSMKANTASQIKMTKLVELNRKKVYSVSMYLKGNGQLNAYIYYYDKDKKLIENMPWNGTGTTGISYFKSINNWSDWSKESFNITAGLIEQYNPVYFSVSFRVVYTDAPIYVDDVSVTETDASSLGVDFEDNIVANPTLESNNLWQANTVFDKDEYHTYPSSAKLDAAAGTSSVLRNTDYYSAIDAAKTYEISCFMKATAEGNVVQLAVQLAEGQGSSAQNIFVNGNNVIVTEDWKQYKAIIQVPNGSYKFIRPSITCAAIGAKSGYIYVDDVTIKGFYYPDSMTIEGDNSVNLMEMSDESLEKQYSAVLKYGDVLSDADVVWAIESEQQEDIRISDSGVLSANAKVKPGVTALIKLSLPEHYPVKLSSEKMITFTYDVSDEYKENLQKILYSDETMISSFLEDPNNEKPLMQIGFDIDGFNNEILDAENAKEALIKDFIDARKSGATLDENIYLLNEKVFLKLVNLSSITELERLLGAYDEDKELGLGENNLYKKLCENGMLMAKTKALESIRSGVPYNDIRTLRETIDDKIIAACFSYITSGQVSELLEEVSVKISLDKKSEFKSYLNLPESNSVKIKINNAMVRKYDSSQDIYDAFMVAYKEITKELSLGSSSGSSSSAGRKTSNIKVPYKPADTLNNPTGTENTGSEDNVDKNIVFTDLENAAWAETDIVSLAEKGIINGYEDGTFRPENYVSREEFLKMLVIAFDMVDETAKCSFDDVQMQEWYYPFIASAVKYNITQGTELTMFGIGQNITREQAATFVSRVLYFYGYAEENGNRIIKEVDTHFADHKKISEYAEAAVYTMKNFGIISGFPDNKFKPEISATRAEAAKIINAAYRLKQQ